MSLPENARTNGVGTVTKNGIGGPARETIPKLVRVDKSQIPSTGKWKIRAVNDNAEPESDLITDKYSDYSHYAFIVRRKKVQTSINEFPRTTTTILIRSEELRTVAKDVLKNVPYPAWNSRSFKASTEPLLASLPAFKRYLVDLESKNITKDKDLTIEHLTFFINFLNMEYAPTLQKINALTLQDEVTFDLLWTILLPRSILLTTCDITSEPRAVRLLRTYAYETSGEHYLRLTCEYVDARMDSTPLEPKLGLATLTIDIPKFEHVMKITDLKAYPLERSPNEHKIRTELIARGRRWVNWSGVHHVVYKGLAYNRGAEASPHKLIVEGRAMIDRRTFSETNWSFELPAVRESISLKQEPENDVEDEDLLLASPILYGFSLVDNLWVEFNVEHIAPIVWNDQLFGNLAINRDQKVLIQSLIESEVQLDDFVKGKGLGLVINLFGIPPGVGKTLTVEATSEHLRRPLYIVNIGDLGTDVCTVDRALVTIFALAPKWNAIVLIDEADVFLEERSSANLERNSMVAVFLRRIEYFRGIMFLSTNRVEMFDKAFQSRIHLSLRYDALTPATKEHIWRAFLDKARSDRLGPHTLTATEIRGLSDKVMNGRQIKNTVKLAVVLASHENEALGFKHLVRTMNIVEQSGTQKRIVSWVPKGDFYLLNLLGLGVIICLLVFTLLQSK